MAQMRSLEENKMTKWNGLSTENPVAKELRLHYLFYFMPLDILDLICQITE